MAVHAHFDGLSVVQDRRRKHVNKALPHTLSQGGLVVARLAPGSRLEVAGKLMCVGAQGVADFGAGRDEPLPLAVSVLQKGAAHRYAHSHCAARLTNPEHQRRTAGHRESAAYAGSAH
jgi:hypothetical protein